MFFIHSSVMHLGCSHILTSVNNSVMYMESVGMNMSLRNLFAICSARNQTQGLMYARQGLYYRATSSVLPGDLMFSSFR
jgi:hypothetical protein